MKAPSNAAKACRVRAIPPMLVVSRLQSTVPCGGMRQTVTLSPYNAALLAGRAMEPSVSVTKASGANYGARVGTEIFASPIIITVALINFFHISKDSSKGPTHICNRISVLDWSRLRLTISTIGVFSLAIACSSAIDSTVVCILNWGLVMTFP